MIFICGAFVWVIFGLALGYAGNGGVLFFQTRTLVFDFLFFSLFCASYLRKIFFLLQVGSFP